MFSLFSGFSRRQMAELRFQLANLKDFIMSTQAEIAAGLSALNTQVGKIAAETSGLKDKVAALETEIANAGGVSPELQSAFDAVKASVQSLDDLVPDAVETPPEGEQPQG